jgi:hypothetical protein
MALIGSNNIKSDLFWNLQEVSNKRAGQILIKTLCKYIPTYSSGAQQIYSEGECQFTSADSVVFHPNTADFTKTFSRIPATAVRNTSIHLFTHGKQGLTFLQQKSGKAIGSSAFSATLNQILSNIDKKQGFIPILQKSDVQDTADKKPLLKLSTLDIKSLETEFSSFEISTMLNELKKGFMDLNAL